MSSQEPKRKFKLSLYCTKSEFELLQSQINAIKTESKKSSTEVINSALTLYSAGLSQKEVEINQSCDKKTSEEPVLLTSPSAINNLNSIVSLHNAKCTNCVRMVASQTTGYASSFTVKCNICDFDYMWNSSLQLPNGMDLINMRVVHSYFTSGMIPSQLERFSDCLGAGTIGKNKMQTFVNVFSEVVAAERQLSCENAISQEVQASESPEGIDIITDARDGTQSSRMLCA